MKKEILTKEKVEKRWTQMEEMNQIWDKLSEREKGRSDCKDIQKCIYADYLCSRGHF